MRAFLIHLILFTAILSVGAQRRYQLPHGISESEIDSQWIIVKINDDGADFQVSNQVRLLHTSSSQASSILDGMCKIRVNTDQDPVQLINELLKDPRVQYAEPILNYQLLYIPSDPDNQSDQSYLDQISAYDAWDVTRGDDDITIGIIDTGIDYDHEDLASSIWLNEADPIDGQDNDNNGYVDDYYGYDFADEDDDPNSDGNPHGTRVAGVAGASTDNAIGISGIGFNTKVAALKGFTTVGTTSNNLFEAIIYAADMGMQVLNLSWGSVREPLQSEQDILDYAVLEKDVVISASAGNDGAQANPEALFYPASYNNVLSVGAVDSDDNRSSNSTYNYLVDLMAPGVSLYSTVNDDAYGSQSGTSFSSPLVAGAAALVRAAFPELDAQQVMEQVRVSTDDIYGVGSNSFFDGKLGSGRLNAFNAVSQADLKSVRVTDFDVQTPHSNRLFFGDTVTLTTHLTNFLASTGETQIIISSPDANFTIDNSTVFVPGMSSLDQDSTTFQFILDETLAPETPVFIRFDFMEGAYADFQHILTTTSPDHFDLGSNFKMTIAGNGNLGYADVDFFDGIGIGFDGNTILRYAGLLTAIDQTTVSDNIISDYSDESREQDYGSRVNYKLYHHPAADQFGYSEFEDLTNSLVIEQSTYAWIDNNFIILRYRIINNTATSINNLSLGFFTDFDLGDPLTNSATYDATNEYIFTKDLSETLFTATKIISTGTAAYSALNVGNQNGNDFDVETVFSDASKYDLLTNQQFISSGDLGDGNDVAMLNGATIGMINGFEDEYVAVIIAAGSSRAELETEIVNAENRLSDIISNPRILESLFSCGSEVTINPTAGNVYQFFQDPQGSIQLHEGSEFTTGSISQDTVFYAKNIDGPYASDIFQVPVKLITDIADFKMEPDTLYLDQATNVVTFTDQSFQANLWNWDFDEGTTSTIQNPMLSFGQPGEYEITLSVENVSGCSDTAMKTLVVTNRPASPTFSSFTICPGDFITLFDPTADFLKVYTNLEDAIATQQGNDLEVGPFFENTTIYVSGVYGQFESLKTLVDIDLEVFSTDFTIEIDTISTAHQIIVRAPQNAETIEWFVNDVSMGSEDQITIDSSILNVTIRLQQTNTNECTVSEERTFNFSSSSIPSQQDISFCSNEAPLLKPQNGEIFGFYADAELTDLIKKGTELLVVEESKVFIVGLDDGLPSDPREVNVSFEDFDLEIVATTEKIGDKNRVTFDTSPIEGLTQHQWFIDGTLSAISPSPVFVLADDLYEVVLTAVNENGCEHTDTLQLDLIPPLGTSLSDAIEIYPNPSQGLVTFTSSMQIHSMVVWDIAGNYIFEMDLTGSSVNLNQLAPGIYLLKLKTIEGIFSQKLIIK